MAKSFKELVSRTTTAKVRQRASERTKELLGEMLLVEVRKSQKVSQSALAKIIGIRQPSLSRLEKQADMQISTLGRIIKALGGTLVLNAKFQDKVVTIGNFSKPTRKPKRSVPVAKRRTQPV